MDNISSVQSVVPIEKNTLLDSYADSFDISFDQSDGLPRSTANGSSVTSTSTSTALTLSLQPPGELLPRIAEEKDSPTSAGSDGQSIADTTDGTSQSDRSNVVTVASGKEIPISDNTTSPAKTNQKPSKKGTN